MQIKDNSDSNFNPPSFLDSNLQVTANINAISLVKKAYISDSPGAEHLFIVIQKPNFLYRVEVMERKTYENGKPRIDYVICDTFKEFITQKGFEKVSHEIIWGTRDTKRHPADHLFHKTMLVSSEACDKLLMDIAKEVGPEDISQKKAIEYTVLGFESVLAKHNIWGTVKKTAATITSSAVVPCTWIMGDVLIDVYLSRNLHILWAHHVREKSAVVYYTFCASVFMTFYGTYKLCETGLNAIYPTVDKTKMHSCSSWATEKFYDMRDDQVEAVIADDVITMLYNKVAHIPSFNVGDTKEKLRFIANKTGIDQCTVDITVEDSDRKKAAILAGGTVGCTIAATGTVLHQKGNITHVNLITSTGIGYMVGGTTGAIVNKVTEVYPDSAVELINETRSEIARNDGCTLF